VHPFLHQLRFDTVADMCNECIEWRVIWDSNIRYILCHFYGPAKFTYGLKSVQRCEGSKNMVTFLKKHNQKVSVCTTAINTGGLRTTHHLPWEDQLIWHSKLFWVWVNCLPVWNTHFQDNFVWIYDGILVGQKVSENITQKCFALMAMKDYK
jgi:hypothetical protein